MSGYKSPLMREVCIFGWALFAGQRVGIKANFGTFKPGFERTYDELTKNLTQADLNRLAIGALPPEMAFAAPGEPPLFHLMTPDAYHAEFDDDEDDEDDETPNDEPIDEEGDE
mgnify:CR=1 FL=1|jgi:hypothetical protein